MHHDINVYLPHTCQKLSFPFPGGRFVSCQVSMELNPGVSSSIMRAKQLPGVKWLSDSQCCTPKNRDRDLIKIDLRSKFERSL